MRQLVELADEFQPLATLRVSDFIRFVEKEKMESPSRSLVRVMTIHQAKGLEFDVVILGELETRLTSVTRPGYVTSEPDPFAGPDGVCLYVDEKFRDSLPAHVQEMFQSSALREVREALCLLYVAMTRAARALYMICPPLKASEKTMPRSYAGILNAAMLGRSLTAEEVISRGDPEWFQSLPPELRRTRPTRQVPEADPVPFAAGDRDAERARDRLSPSRKPLAGRIRLSQALMSAGRETLDRASLIHAWFESIEWLDDGRPSRESLQAIADELGMSKSDVADCLPRFQAMLNRPEIAFSLSRTSYSPPTASMLWDSGLRAELAAEPLRLEVERERRFVVREGNAVVAGAIDRLVLMFRGAQLLAADILDFKTDAPTAGFTEAQARRSHYQSQLACYARAVAGIYQLAEDRISTRLVMVSQGRVEAVDWRQQSGAAGDADRLESN
jgi:ATP-dependent exoDNAse (exonuclease V) beta subunit